MSKFAVVYWSGGGNTEEMAKAVCAGFEEKGHEGVLIEASDFSSGDVAQYEGIAFGCSAQGSEVLEEGSFQPMWDGVKGDLKGKKLGLFGSYGWGGGEFANIWKTDAEEAGLVVADVCTCQEAPDDDGIAACKTFAATVAG